MPILAFLFIVFCFMSIDLLEEKPTKESSKQNNEPNKEPNEILILDQNSESNLSSKKKETIMSKYFFTDKEQLVNYLYSVLKNPTNVKVQKTLYLLFAYYGATYGQLEESAEFSYPPYLFDAYFIADKHGPVQLDILEKQLTNTYSKKMTIGQVMRLFSSPEKENIKDFIQNIVEQVNEIDDYNLVHLAKQDKTWQDAAPYNAPMLNDYIIQEYIPRI